MLRIGVIDPYASGSCTKYLVLVQQGYTPFVSYFCRVSTRVPRPGRPRILVTIPAPALTGGVRTVALPRPMDRFASVSRCVGSLLDTD